MWEGKQVVGGLVWRDTGVCGGSLRYNESRSSALDCLLGIPWGHFFVGFFSVFFSFSYSSLFL